MRSVLIVFLALAVGTTVPANDKKPAKPLEGQMQGEWLMVKGLFGGEEKKKTDEVKFVVKDNTITIMDPGGKIEKATFKLDESKKPAAIDLMAEKGPKEPILGIVRVEGDKMTFCFVHDGGAPRPTEFASPAKTRTALLELKRVTK